MTPEEKRARYSDPAYREKLARSCRELWANPDRRKAHSERALARCQDPGVRERMSESARAFWADPMNRAIQSQRVRDHLESHPETRAAWIAYRTGKKSSDETRRKQSAATKGIPKSAANIAASQKALRDPVVHAARVAAMRAHYDSDPDARKRASETSKRTHARPEVKEKVMALMSRGRETQKRQLAAMTPEERSAHPQLKNFLLAGQIASAHTTESSIERAIQECLRTAGIAHECHVRFGRYVVDILIRERQIVIECDGTYWHSLDKAKATEPRRNDYLIGLGLSVIHLLEPDIRRDPMQAMMAGFESLQKGGALTATSHGKGA